MFAQRLEVLGISNEKFAAILNEPADSIRSRYGTTPAWLKNVAGAFTGRSSPAATLLEGGTNEPIFGLLNVARPFISRGLSNLEGSISAILGKYPKPPVTLGLVKQVFLHSVERQLLAMVSKVAVLELNVERVKGSLWGETQQDRYRSFVERLDEPETALAILQEYPVLARQIVIRVDQWVTFLAEFVERLCSDWDAILSTVGRAEIDPGPLCDLEAADGDRHRGGRCVLIGTFRSGFKLVYKPKSMAVDAHFQQLLSWINSRGSHPRLRTLKVLDCGSYGWSEFVAPEKCRSLGELQRFYERQGAYLALLYVLEATDFHSENIIAAGEHPVPIDLEAIFHPRLQGSAQSEQRDDSILAHSILRVGLLPWHDYATEESERLDISGLGGAAGQLTPQKVPYWEMAGTDEMKLSRRQMPISACQNRPSLGGVDEVAASDYVQEITAGFTRVYRLLMKHRDELVAPGGPLSRFEHDEVRVILRPTKSYGILLNESFHPDVMRDALDRDLLFDRLWIAVEACPYLTRVISAECEDLQRGDIPFFSTRPNSVDVWSSTNQRIPRLFEQSALLLVQHRLQRLDENDLQLQRWLIRASLATTIVGHSHIEHSHVEPGRAASTKQQRGTIERTRLLEAACAVADSLESSAIRWNGGVSWAGLGVADERKWCLTTTGLDLYDGLPGIAMFFAYLGSITGESRYTELGYKTCDTMLRRLEKCALADLSVGGFAGWGGVVYALAHLGFLWRDSKLSREAENIVQRVSGLSTSDRNFDIIAGSAGWIACLIALYQQRPSPAVLVAAKACGEHLAAHAEPMPAGVGWIIPRQAVALSGFAHGAAGIAWALSQLGGVSGEELFPRTADAAIAYERTLFDPEAANWRDLRTWGKSLAKTEGPPMSAWCHGAAGIGLARLTSAGQGDRDEVRREIDTALGTTIRTGLGHNHSLCHGDGGRVELLLQAGHVLKHAGWNLEAHQIAHDIVDSISRNEYRCGTPLDVDAPGLMTGIAGIGYALLRLAEPGRVPSVLTLEPATGA